MQLCRKKIQMILKARVPVVADLFWAVPLGHKNYENISFKIAQPLSNTRLDLILNSARSHPLSVRSHPPSVRLDLIHPWLDLIHLGHISSTLG